MRHTTFIFIIYVCVCVCMNGCLMKQIHLIHTWTTNYSSQKVIHSTEWKNHTLKKWENINKMRNERNCSILWLTHFFVYSFRSIFTGLKKSDWWKSSGCANIWCDSQILRGWWIALPWIRLLAVHNYIHRPLQVHHAE